MYNKNYNELKYARIIGWQTLLDCDIKSLPVNLHQIVKKLGYSYHTYSKSALTQVFNQDVLSGDGFIVEIDNKKHIYINDKINDYRRRRFTMGHEIGHGVCDQPLDTIHFRHSEYDNADQLMEMQANVVARGILAPACILKELDIHSADEIMEICDISRASAEIRAKRMEFLYKQNKFYMHPLEAKVRDNFDDFIKNYWKNKS